ncbi:MAG: hypothetical protein ACO36F_09125 [Ilumatobacteraceae bacterium]
MRFASVVQVLGVVSVAVGAFLIAPSVGFIAAGIGAVLLGVALEGGR